MPPEGSPMCVDKNYRIPLVCFRWLVALLVVLASGYVMGQTVSASLNGTVKDASGAVVPGANVVLMSESSGAARTTVTNHSGYFSFPSLLPGTYTVTVNKPGFASWEQKGLILNQNESRTVAGITLGVRGTSQKITVSASAAPPVPLDTGQSRTTLNNKMVSQLAIQGRNASELIRLMPAMAMNTGLGQRPWTSQLTQINSGPAGQYSASGSQPNGGMQLTMDGAVILDPGNQGTQVANVNQDQTQEVTIMNSAFDAQYAHGPGVFSAVGKRGGAKYHGEGYVYMRNGSLNAEDALQKSSGLTKPIDHYWYPGFNVGGPIPGILKRKLFFFGGYEYMMQHPVPVLHKYVVPTAAMLGGDFSPTSIGAFTNLNSGVVPCSNASAPNYSNFCAGAVSGGTITNGVISPSLIDPNGLALLKLMPAPNANPATTGGYNFLYQDYLPVNSQNLRLRADADFTQNTHAYFSFNLQPETDRNNIGVWWWPSSALPYPSPLPADQKARDYSASLTHVFSPTLTNETTFAYAYFINPVQLSNAGAVNPANVGYSVTTPFSQLVPQIPNVTPNCCWDGGGNNNTVSGSAGFYGPAFGTNWYKNGDFGKDSKTPSIDDNLTWILGSHSAKFGAFWASYANVQTEGFGSGPNGSWGFGGAPNETGNELADMLIGHAASFSQTNTIPVDNVRYREFAFYGQDSWKVLPRLTFDYGVRVEHEGQWTPVNDPNGLMVWDPATYSPTATGLSGFVWNATNPSVPLSGFKSPGLKPDPRVGIAYDLFGNGRTVLRGGFGIYRYQIAYNDITQNGMLGGPLGIVNYSSNCTFTHLSDLASCGAAAAGARTSQTFGGAMMGDGRTPYNENWDVIIDQRVPWSSLLELEYQGSRSRNLLITGNGTNQGFFANINKIQPGALFAPDPVTGVTYYCTGTASATCNPGAPPGSALPDYRPYTYNALDVYTHGSYSNYNALVVQWQKQTGPGVFNVNYTWSHALGVRDGNSNNGNSSGAVVDPFSLAANYGSLAFDRRHIFNASYVINLPSPIKGNALAEGVVNGWQLSGVTTFQSGPPIQPLTGGNLNAAYASGVGNQSVLGTDSEVLVPYLVCNPTANLASGQYFNPACFANPTMRGVNGPVIMPNFTGPGFFDSDLGLYKNFKITESQALQVRATAFNFINHPNPQFGLTNDVNLTFYNATGPTASNQNAVTDGRPHNSVGNRVLELALKYTF